MNIYVSNLNFGTTSEGLQELFSGFGEVTSAKVITDRESGRSRGFGFVEMSNDSEGNQAISELHDTDLDGKTINVNVARPRVERDHSGYENRSRSNDYNRNRY